MAASCCLPSEGSGLRTVTVNVAIHIKIIVCKRHIHYAQWQYPPLATCHLLATLPLRRSAPANDIKNAIWPKMRTPWRCQAATWLNHNALGNTRYAFAKLHFQPAGHVLKLQFHCNCIIMAMTGLDWTGLGHRHSLPASGQIKRSLAININKNHTKIAIRKVQATNENGNCS